MKLFFSLFNAAERKRFYWLLGMMTCLALLEVLGVVSIMPFMAFLHDPELIEKNRYFHAFSQRSGISDPVTLQSLAGLLTLCALLLSSAGGMLTNWLLLQFVYTHGHRLAGSLLDNYLKQPYAFFLSRNSAQMSKHLLTEVHRVTIGVVMPLLQLLSKSIVVLCISALLVAINPSLALGAMLLFGCSYTVIYRLIRQRITAYGAHVAQAETTRFKTTSEIFGGIKEILVTHKRHKWENAFNQESMRFATFTARADALKLFPRYILEVIAYGGLVIIALYLLRMSQQPNLVLPILALYAFAGYRLMPALQQIYHSLTQLRYHRHALRVLLKDLQLPHVTRQNSEQANIQFSHSLTLENLSFSYPDGKSVLSDISLSIAPQQMIGLAGASGAGKTTLVDIILGLFQPSNGQLKVDGTPITLENVEAWQNLISYVPQHIFLNDDSIAANIAFGLQAEEIDFVKLKKAADLAQVTAFVDTMPLGFETPVGERGMQLSGGQRQRIGIARALYADKPIIILDEATNALDQLTENAVISAINVLEHKKTVIIIAHRLQMLQACDVIAVLANGRMVDQGDFAALMQKSALFQSLAMNVKE